VKTLRGISFVPGEDIVTIGQWRHIYVVTFVKVLLSEDLLAARVFLADVVVVNLLCTLDLFFFFLLVLP
jgi:hypothetical protein